MNLWQFNVEHIKEQTKKRYRHLNDHDVELKRIFKALENSVPDDWRLSRFSPGFIIRDIKTGITLVGTQKRIKKTTQIVKYVETCIEKGAFLKEKRAKFSDRRDSKQISSRPNLFIGETSSDNNIFKSSLVLVRQYEKVNPGKSNIEYFKCHPLTRNGLNKKYVWIEWLSKNGETTINKNPPKDFHGEDFWRLEDVFSL